MKFVGGEWSKDSKAGTFRRFLEAHENLERAAFLERVTWPHLVIGAELDMATWDQGIVIRAAPTRGDPEVAVGRAVDGDVVLNCPSVSRRHLALRKVDGVWGVSDLCSTHGTLVDGKRLAPGAFTALARDAAPWLEIGPDVVAVFMTPEQLHDFVTRAKASRGMRPPPPRDPRSRVAWPTWSLLQDPPAVGSETTDNLPLEVTPELGNPLPRAGRMTRAAPPRGLASLFATRQRKVTTAVVALVLLLVVRVYGFTVAYMLFGEQHPNWFRP